MSEAVDYCWNESALHGLTGANSDFANRRVGKKFDFARHLAEDHRIPQCPFEKRSTVWGGFNAFGYAVEELDTKHMLQVRDSVRYCWLRYRQDLGRLGHAAGLRDGDQGIEIAQFDLRLSRRSSIGIL